MIVLTVSSSLLSTNFSETETFLKVHKDLGFPPFTPPQPTEQTLLILHAGMHKHHLHPCWKKIISLILQFWGLFQRPQLARPYRHFPLRPEMRGSSLAMGPALATCRSDRRETPQGAGTPQGKRGSPPSPRSPSDSGPGGESWVKPRRRPRKGGGNASRPTPEKLTTTPPHVAPPNPVSLTKATAARAHHLVPPSPS